MDFLDDFDFDLFDDDGKEQEQQEQEQKQEAEEQKQVKVSHRLGYRPLTRKASSEKALEEAFDTWHFKAGDCFHCFSFGDVDSLSYFKLILRQQHINYALLSTWCMAGEDVKDIREWYRKGMIDRIDFFVGEIFKGSYPDCYDLMQDFIQEENGRMVVFRNHSKVMAIKGEHFDAVIESSANVNTNPRSEQAVITCDSELTDWYINLFADINPFNKDYGNEPYRIIRKGDDG